MVRDPGENQTSDACSAWDAGLALNGGRAASCCLRLHWSQPVKCHLGCTARIVTAYREAIRQYLQAVWLLKPCHTR